MKTATFEVRFQPDGLRAKVEAGTLLTDVMKKLGLSIQLPCAGTGKCGKCRVEIHPDTPPAGSFDRLHLSPAELESGVRLACQVRVDRPMSVLVSEGMRVLDGKILVDGVEKAFELAPVVRKTFVELPEPSLADQTADFLRLTRVLGLPDDRYPAFDIDMLRELSSVLRSSGYKATAVLFGDKIIAVEPGDTTARLFGIAFDIGTTTVVGTILDFRTGLEVGRASRLNAQVVYGEDTISRIEHAITAPEGRHDMYTKIRGVINEIVSEAARKASVKPAEIYEAVIVGNTTMSHLFLGLDVEGLSRIPFVPAITAPVDLPAAVAGIAINPRGNVHVLPNIAGFVGSDTVGVMLTCDYLDEGPVVLAVDVGTNGELALRRDNRLMVCSTAAGPALEGAALSCGMRAASGAIEHVRITPERVELDVIGTSAPIGLCGSGIIDLLAELLNAGIIDSFGTMQTPDALKGNVPDYLLDRITVINDQPAFVVSAGERDVHFTQRDVRQIQLAKGAIRAGITLLLKQMEITPDDLDQLFLAGAFGNYIRKESARRIGLLPPIPLEKIRFIGNAASTGAKMALLSENVRRDAACIERLTEHLELANLPEFTMELGESMLF